MLEVARELGCRVVALGHHQDDIIETFFLNLLFQGEMSTMLPRQGLFNDAFRLIRPLSLVDEDRIRRYAHHMEIPYVENPCPFKDSSRRADVKMLLEDLYRKDRRIRKSIFRALSNPRVEYLLSAHREVRP